ncbi:hypothetical protein SDC9_62470 [bioreactor metagenome]|uniref:Uncharacterized protein n=1 Tax=bioreactor metagenome TaxID=1076179 RepID=A0A644XIR0_9ZZZZ
MDDQAPHKDGRHCITGNSEGEHGDECTAGTGVVGRLGSCNTFNDAGSQELLALAEALLLSIGHQSGNRTAGGRKGTDQNTDEGGADYRTENPLDVLDRRNKLRKLLFDRHLVFGAGNLYEHLG